LSRSWLFLTVPAAVAALGLLSWTVVSLLRTVRGSVVTTVPIRAEQRLTINGTGEFAFNLEGPIGSLRPMNLRYELSSADGATRIPLAQIVWNTDMTSMSRSRMELYRFTLPSAGEYLLHIDGINPTADYSDVTIVITRQYRGSLVLHMLALIALGTALIGCIVVSGLVLSGKSFAPATSFNSNATAEQPLDAVVANSAAIVRARIAMHGGAPRFQVLETWCGAVPSSIAGAGQPEGLIVNTLGIPASDYRPIEGGEVVLILAPTSDAQVGGGRTSVVVAEPLAILPISAERVIYAPNNATFRRELSASELRQLCTR
jgi:hypothetical protein